MEWNSDQSERRLGLKADQVVELRSEETPPLSVKQPRPPIQAAKTFRARMEERRERDKRREERDFAKSERGQALAAAQARVVKLEKQLAAAQTRIAKLEKQLADARGRIKTAAKR
jgi:hypothetical protein